MRTVVLATGNPGKLSEHKTLLNGYGIRVLPQADFGVHPPEETGTTFLENALLKAQHAACATGWPVIAEDSGLEVDALQGAPGIHSARYAGSGASDADNLEKLLQAMRSVPREHRTARFRCVMVYLGTPTDASPVICEGTWEGHILDTPRGCNGFGYDPVFLVGGNTCSSAELPVAEKTDSATAAKRCASS